MRGVVLCPLKGLQMHSVEAKVLDIFRYSNLHNIVIVLFIAPSLFCYVIVYKTFTNLRLVFFIFRLISGEN